MPLKYGGERRKAEDVVKDSKTSGGLYDSYLLPDTSTFKSIEGENRIRILPASWLDPDGSPSKDWAYGVFLHYDIGPDGAAFICNAKMNPGQKCCVCEARKNAVDEEESYALKFSWRPHAYIINRKSDNPTPLPWGMPVKQMFNEINARSIDRHSGALLLIDHPEKGYDVYFNREGVKNRTKYTAVDIARDPSILSKDDRYFWAEEDSKGNVTYGGEWLDHIAEHPIPSLLVFHDQEYIESVLYARGPSRKEKEEERSSRRDRDSDREKDDDRSSRRGDRSSEADEIRGRSSREDERPARRRSEEDERPARREREEEERPTRRRVEDEAPSRRSRIEDDPAPKRERSEEPTRRRLATEDDEQRPSRRGNGSGDKEDDPPFEPRSRRSSDDDPDATKTAKAELEELRSSRRSRD